MAVSNKKATFKCDRKKVWDKVVSLEDYSWRSDIERIEVLGDGNFAEYTRDGFRTTFTVTVKEEFKRYELDMENENMKGHWTGVFSETEEAASVDFTEEVTVKKVLMRPFAGAYLKKQQKKYIEDLRKELES